MSADTIFYQQIVELSQSNKSFSVVTLLQKEGSVPQVAGAKMIIELDKSAPSAGTIGGGKLENAALIHAQSVLHKKDPHAKIESKRWNLLGDLGMNCGGAVTLFFEYFYSEHRWKTVVFGAGHIAQSLIPLLCQLGSKVVCIDERLDWLGKLEKNENLETIHLPEFQGVSDYLQNKSYYICITKGFQTDFFLAKKILGNCDPLYLGVIGSDTKAKHLRRELRGEANITPEQIARIHSPIGLKLGGTSPFEIALSITAELMQIRNKCQTHVQ